MQLDIDTVTKHLHLLSPSKQKEVLTLLDQLSAAKNKALSQKDFLSFVKEVWPAFIEGAHLKIMADAFHLIADGTLTRLLVNMSPRHTTSVFA